MQLQKLMSRACVSGILNVILGGLPVARLALPTQTAPKVFHSTLYAPHLYRQDSLILSLPAPALDCHSSWPCDLLPQHGTWLPRSMLLYPLRRCCLVDNERSKTIRRCAMQWQGPRPPRLALAAGDPPGHALLPLLPFPHGESTCCWAPAESESMCCSTPADSTSCNAPAESTCRSLTCRIHPVHDASTCQLKLPFCFIHQKQWQQASGLSLHAALAPALTLHPAHRHQHAQSRHGCETCFACLPPVAP